MSFKKVTIRGVPYGGYADDCLDALAKEVTNFSMVDPTLDAVLE